VAANSITRNLAAVVALPSEDEWYKAAYYNPSSSGWFDYPTGSDSPPACSPPTVSPNSANCNLAWGGLVDGGSYPGSPSPYGTFDQGGNSWEWNEAVIFGTERGVRGGAYHVPAIYFAASTRGNTDPTGNENIVGFRVVNLPEPGVTLQLAAGIAALLGLSRRRAG
jgi:formylglycine-generating enzyme required for sulfatase activity